MLFSGAGVMNLYDMEAETLPDPHILYLLGAPPKRLLYAKHCCVDTMLWISYRGKQDRYDFDSEGVTV